MTTSAPLVGDLQKYETGAFSNLIELLYRAPLDPSAWKEFLLVLSQTFNARGAHLGITNIATGFVERDEVTGYEFSPVDYEAYKGSFRNDPRVKQMRAKPMRATHCRELLSDDEFRGTKVYQNVLSKVDMEYTLCAALDSDPEEFKFIAIMRGKDGRPFAEYDRTALEVLLPHVAQAMRIDRELTDRRNIESLARDAVGNAGIGWIALDATGTVLNHNEAAEDVIPALTQGVQLNFPDAQGVPLARHIDKVMKPEARNLVAFTTRSPDGHHVPTVLARQSGTVSLQSWAQPKSATFNLLFAGRSTGTETTKISIIKAVYGLSNRQAQIAAHIAAGDTIRATAEHLQIQESTARQYLKGLMAKLHVRTQAQLALKIAQVTVFDA